MSSAPAQRWGDGRAAQGRLRSRGCAPAWEWRVLVPAGPGLGGKEPGSGRGLCPGPTAPPSHGGLCDRDRISPFNHTLQEPRSVTATWV